jgi:hypothetical protein
MHSDLIGKIAKARRYVQEPERIALVELKATFHGGNHEHDLTLHDNVWHCTCESFHTRGICPHIMALQQILQPMLSGQALAVNEQALGGVHTHMYSDWIGKLEKARRYAQEPERIRIHTLRAVFHGNNHTHQFAFDGEQWQCSCDCFQSRGVCAHVMAAQQLFRPMLSQAALVEVEHNRQHDYQLEAVL